MTPFTGSALKDAWAVFMLFVIPVGGGIPAGVLLAQARGIAWPIMMVLYFFSDVLLAFAFEPILKLFIFWGKHSEFIRSWMDLCKKAMHRSTANYGTTLGPIALVMIAFGVDPMTGRAAAKAAGHGFVSGWLIAIAGDMIFFTILMVSTLWLKSVLGDGTWVTLIILAIMIGVPWVVRRVRKRRNGEYAP